MNIETLVAVGAALSFLTSIVRGAYKKFSGNDIFVDLKIDPKLGIFVVALAYGLSQNVGDVTPDLDGVRAIIALAGNAVTQTAAAWAAHKIAPLETKE